MATCSAATLSQLILPATSSCLQIPSEPTRAALACSSRRPYHGECLVQRNCKQHHPWGRSSTRRRPRGKGSPQALPDLTDNDEVGEGVVPAEAPSQGRFEVVIDNEAIKRLDLRPMQAVVQAVKSGGALELIKRTVGFQINYAREDPLDPRELSEFPEVRLYFVRLDSAYPWLPIVLDWRAGELSRYAAMLVPHQMSRKSGVVFNPESLELFTTSRAFTAYDWLKSQGYRNPGAKCQDMMRMLGFQADRVLFDLLEGVVDEGALEASLRKDRNDIGGSLPSPPPRDSGYIPY